MKISLTLGDKRPLSRQTAWGCFTSNLALPGMGSLVAGYASGYAQALLAVGGMILSIVFGLRFIVWYFDNWSRLYHSQADPTEALGDMWRAIRWALLGIGTFFVGWLWALATSRQILRSVKQNGPASPPPLK